MEPNARIYCVHTKKRLSIHFLARLEAEAPRGRAGKSKIKYSPPSINVTPIRASPPVGCNGHANGGWAGAKSGARSRVPVTPTPKTLRLPAPCTAKSGSRLPQTLISALSVCVPREPAGIFLFAVKNWSQQGSGSGRVFGVNGAPLAVAASPVGPKPGQSSRFPPLAYASQPTVEML